MTPTDIVLIFIALVLVTIEAELVSIRKRIDRASAHLVRLLERIVK